MALKCDPFGETLTAGGLEFPFDLWFKPERFGEVDVAHMWMHTGTLYGQRKRPARNLRMLMDYFWMRCTLAGTSDTRSAQETYVLAHLAPHARGNGSQRVLPDARWARAGRMQSTKADEAADLESLLEPAQRSRDPGCRALTMREFRDRSADALACPTYEDDVKEAYGDVAGPFLDEAVVQLVNRGPAGLDAAIGSWRDLIRTVGRRGGLQLQKQVLDILSYEARAAVHRCYSCVWSDLIRQVSGKYELSVESLRFLQLWHLERVSESDESANSGADFHLFHGHVFALHPACGTLLRTPTGRALMGAYLAAATAETQVQPFQRLLAAINISLHHYRGLRDDNLEGRRKRPKCVDEWKLDLA